MGTNQKNEWEISYANRDNFVFCPHEEVVRFVSRKIRKRIGREEFKDILTNANQKKILDVGCGIGRHVIYLNDMKLQAYGIDLSENAIQEAHNWAKSIGLTDYQHRILQGDITNLPWQDSFFDAAISHGVLDSMHFKTARSACIELHRALKENGIFYCDLISGDTSSHSREFQGEEIVISKHEKGTMQMYYNFQKIHELFYNIFKITECNLIRNENVLTGQYFSRYHIVLKKI